jgi:hypothetical protein
MLSHIWLADAAMPARALSRTGASFAGGCTAVPRERVIETEPARTNAARTEAARTAAVATLVAGLRPQASTGTVLFGTATHAASQANVALQASSQKKYARKTRIATAGGGAMGPQPAWDPV